MDYLASEGFECEYAHDPIDGLEKAIKFSCDAIILDIMMPNLDGIELLRRLRRESSVPVLMLTAKGDNVDRVIGLELGADDYLVKPVFPREMTARLHAVLRRTKSVRDHAVKAKSELNLGPLRMTPSRRECFLNRQPLELTAREYDLLMCLAIRPGEVISKDELSERVMNRALHPYDRSIDVHISHLRRKLEVVTDTIEIETVRSMGYRIKM